MAHEQLPNMYTILYGVQYMQLTINLIAELTVISRPPLNHHSHFTSQLMAAM
jgi:hypothetical protein